MAERTVLKLLMWIASSPIILISRALEAIGVASIRADVKKCVQCIDSAMNIPSRYIDTLISAEDHRNSLHPGVDPVAMIRAVVVRVRFSRLEGASTIEQQFVRVVTSRHERSLIRKLREQVLAIAVVRHRSKRQIAAAYLSVAHFGTRYSGLLALAGNFQSKLEHADMDFVYEAISRLKYPEPSHASDSWKSRISHRCAYIRRREEARANKALQSAQSTMSCLLLAQKPRHHALAAELRR